MRPSPSRIIRHARRADAARVHARGLTFATVLALVGGLLIGGATLARPVSSVGTAFVRVNQVGYPAAASKRAYLMSTVDEAGATFSVSNGTISVYSASIGASLGAWSGTYSFVYALDFGTVTAAGTYTISVSGPAPASSPSFSINTGQNVYGAAIANARSFYQTERDGPNFIPNELRDAAGHLNDRTARAYDTPRVNSSGRFSGDLTPVVPETHLDVSGGWWDAGDYIKGVQTLGYTTAMLHGVLRFPAQLGSGQGAPADFTAEAKFGADWLLRMWDDTNAVFYYQVGIGTGNAKTIGDHDVGFRLPQADDTFGGTDLLYRYIRNRPVFRQGPPGSLISPNLAGRDAAVFAQCFRLFQSSRDAAERDLANRCLFAAEHIFDLSNTNPSGNLTTYIPFSFYPETEWRSDLELGAAELYFAVASGGLPAGLPHTDPSFYLGQAAHWASAYINSADDAADTLNLYDVSGLAHYELHRAIAQAGNPAGLEVTQAALVVDLKKALDGALAQGATDPFGFGFPWSVWDTTTHGTGLSVMASEYDELTGTDTYADLSGRWLANVLGANAWGVSLIVGDGTTFPDCLHHQVANIRGTLDGSPPVLRGAAVEGPNGTLYKGFVTGMRNCPPDDSDPYAQFNSNQAKFKDDVESFSTVEPAVDLTATSPLAFARQAAGLQ